MIFEERDQVLRRCSPDLGGAQTAVPLGRARTWAIFEEILRPAAKAFGAVPLADG